MKLFFERGFPVVQNELNQFRKKYFTKTVLSELKPGTADVTLTLRIS